MRSEGTDICIIGVEMKFLCKIKVLLSERIHFYILYV